MLRARRLVGEAPVELGPGQGTVGLGPHGGRNGFHSHPGRSQESRDPTTCSHLSHLGRPSRQSLITLLCTHSYAAKSLILLPEAPAMRGRARRRACGRRRRGRGRADHVQRARAPGRSGRGAADTRRRLGLQDAPCWAVPTEVNRFAWQGRTCAPSKPRPGRRGATACCRRACSSASATRSWLGRERARCAPSRRHHARAGQRVRRHPASAPRGTSKRCWRLAPGQPSRVGQRVHRLRRQDLNKGQADKAAGTVRDAVGEAEDAARDRGDDATARIARLRRKVGPWNGGGPRLFMTGRSESLRRRL